jgi:hypothetical protein
MDRACGIDGKARMDEKLWVENPMERGRDRDIMINDVRQRTYTWMWNKRKRYETKTTPCLFELFAFLSFFSLRSIVSVYFPFSLSSYSYLYSSRNFMKQSFLRSSESLSCSRVRPSFMEHEIRYTVMMIRWGRLKWETHETVARTEKCYT